MKILLAAVNASFMHTNLAVRYLKTFAEKYLSDEIRAQTQIDIAEFTINQPFIETLRGIKAFEPELVLFSTYIWNSTYISNIIPDIKKILPSCAIGAGGPEVSYSAQKYLSCLPSLDFVINGEGEKTFLEIIENFCSAAELLQNLNETSEKILKIKGISFFKNSKFFFTGFRDLIQNLDTLPFTYPELLEGNFEGNFDGDHKIYYYESNRGCPFSCAYCLSSVENSVRFKSLEKVKAELQIFLDAKVKLVKFVDRTFNLKSERYIEIWRYILEHHNGKTMFHFEIEAEVLSKDALDFLQKVPENVMQFEIGIQSANKKTLEAIDRSQNIEKTAENILKIPKTIHTHVDLIAGLPYEDLASFGKSYDFAMKLLPDALQLGFLKILPGTKMESFAKENGWQWMKNPVYETFSSPYINFDQMMYLKDIEITTDFLWNKHILDNFAKYVFRKLGAWNFISELTDFARGKNVFVQARKDAFWYELIFDFITEKCALKENPFSQLNIRLLKDLLRYDFVLSGKKGNFPSWYKHFYSKENHLKLLDEKGLLHNNRLAFANSEYEEFSFDVQKEFPEENEKKCALLILYKK